VYHSIQKSVQAEAEELEATKRRAEALERQLRDLGVEPKVAAAAVAQAPASATGMAVREYRMDNGARRVQIMATNGPAGSLGSGQMGPGTLIAEFDAVTRVRDEVEGDAYICNVYGPDGKTVVNQVAVPKGPMGGAEIIHVAKVQVHNAPTAAALEHQQLLIAQGKLRAPDAVVQKQVKRLPVEITLTDEVQPVTRAHADETEERFALIELGDKE
jgi:hypothetical protein